MTTVPTYMYLPTYLHTYMYLCTYLRYLPTYLPTYLHVPMYLPTLPTYMYLPTCTYLPTYLPTYMYLPTYLPACQPAYLPTPTYLPAMKINMSTIGNYGLPFQENQHAYTSASPWKLAIKSGSSIVQSLLALMSTVPPS